MNAITNAATTAANTAASAATTAATTVSNLIYGDTTKNNETDGKEPISGQQGKGTANDPFDQGNSENPVTKSSSTNAATSGTGNTMYKQDDFLKLDPVINEPTEVETKDLKTTPDHSNVDSVLTLNPDIPPQAGAHKPVITEPTATTDKASITDKLWKPTALDDISRSGAPGAGPPAPDFATTTPATAPSSATPATTHTSTIPDSFQGSSTPNQTPATAPSSAIPATTHTSTIPDSFQGSATPNQAPTSHENIAIRNSKERAEASLDSAVSPKTSTSTSTGVAGHNGNFDSGNSASSHDAKKSLVGEHTGHKSESSKTADVASSDEKSGKMSHLKEKLKDKLHIGSKDK